MASKFSVNRHATQKYSVLSRVVSDNAPVVVANSAQSINDIDFVITFYVSDLDGNPITDATISILSSKIKIVNHFDGSYKAMNVIPGEYQFNVSRPGMISQGGNVTVTVSDVDVAVQLCEPPSKISSKDIKSIMNEEISEQLTFVGSKPGVWSYVEGTFPRGISIGSDGLISGTPTEFGKYDFTVKVTNPCGELTKKINMYVCAKPTIATSSNLVLPYNEQIMEQLQFSGSGPGTWSVVDGELPTGVTLNGKSGVLSGISTQFGDFHVTLKVVNPCGEVEKDIQITICAEPRITSNDDVKLVMGEEAKVQLTAYGNPGVWSIAEGRLPSGLSLDEEGLITGTPTIFGFFNCTIRVINACGEDFQYLKVYICGKPEVSPENINVVVGEAMTHELQFMGTRPGKWSVAEGELPKGLSLDADTGIISGTPRVFGDFNLKIKVTNPCGEAIKEVGVGACMKPTIISCCSGCDSEFVRGKAVEMQYEVHGSAGVWSVTGGHLPSGLVLDPNTGVISGTPTAGGYFEFNLKFTNACGEVEKCMSIFVCVEPVIRSGDMDFVMGEEKTVELRYEGSRPGIWSISEGVLPKGLTLDSENGTISGTPKVFGDYSFTLKVANHCSEATKDINVSICGKPEITTAGNMNLMLNEGVHILLESNGTKGVWSSEFELPEGLILTADGLLTGKPTESGNFNVQLILTNDCGQTSKNINIFVCSEPEIITGDFSVLQNTPMSKQLMFAGSRPGRWSVVEGNFPWGIQMDNKGVVSGTTTKFGSFSATVKVENYCGEATKVINVKAEQTQKTTFIIKLEDGTPVSDASVKVGDFIVNNNNDGTYVTHLTDGSHEYSVTKTGYEIEDGVVEVRGEDVVVVITLCVFPAILSGDMDFVMGEEKTIQLEASGTTGVWSVQGSLPAGLTLNSVTGEISGTPSVFGEFKITVIMTNPCGSVNKPITIDICGKPEITSSSDMGFVMGEAKSVQLQFVGTEPVTWEVSEGVLPEGLELNTETGVISGVATEFGDFTFTVKAINECGEKEQEINMFVCAKPEVTSSGKFDFVMTEQHSEQLTSFGTQGTWSIVGGTLPAGLSLDAATGIISGNPTVFGDFNITVKVTNDCGEATKEMLIYVCGLPAITSEDMEFVMGDNVSHQLESEGTKGTWVVLSGALPAGLTLSADGVISGVATESGDFSVVIRMTNTCGVARKIFNIFVCAKPQITSANNINFKLDEEVSFQLAYTGTLGRWSVEGDLPNGVTLRPSTGLISGVPTESGNFAITVKVVYPCGEAIQSINIFVCAEPTVIVSNIEFLANVPMSKQLEFSGSRPGRWNIVSGSFPNGVTMSTNGIVSGTPTEIGNFAVTVRVANPCGEDTKEITMFSCAKPVITSGNNIDFVAGEPFAFQLEATGTEGTWAIISGALPEGLTLSANGEISGMTTASGSYKFTVQITNPCGEANKPMDLNVCAKPVVVTGDLDFVQNTPVSHQLRFTGSRPGTWAIVAGNLPLGLALNPNTGVISGMTPEFGEFNFTVEVTNPCGVGSKNINMNTCSKPAIMSGDMSFVINEPGSSLLEQTGTQGVWSIESGALPTGLSLNEVTGEVSGTPTVSGNYSFVVKVTNSCGDASKTINLSICAKPSVVTNDMTLVMGEATTHRLQFAGTRPGEWSIEGTLPTGLVFSAENETISGTPTEFGEFDVILIVKNPCGEASKTINITICARPNIVSDHGDFVMNEAGSVQLEATGTEGTWSIDNGSLPNGLSLSADGVISGTPTVSGTHSFTVKFKNPCGEAIKTILLYICSKPSIISGDMDIVMGDTISHQLLFAGTRPGTWSLDGGAFPTGLSMNDEGLITGRTAEFGEFVVSIKVTNPCGEDVKDITINTCSKPTVTSDNHMSFVMGESGSAILTSSGTAGTWSISSGTLPEGLSLNTDTGEISGTPTVAGGFNFTAKITNPCGEATKNITMAICAKPTVLTGDMGLVMGNPMVQQLEFSGSRPGVWSIEGTLPTGLTFNADTGVIIGTPTVFGDFEFTAKIENACGENSKVININICAKPTILCCAEMNFVKGEAGSAQLESSGTAGLWSIIGTLPEGLTLDAETGIVNGTPVVSGSYSFTIKITNPCGENSQPISIHICEKPMVVSGDMEFVMGNVGLERLVYSGTRPGMWEITAGSLPNGLTMEPETGIVSGTPTEFGEFAFTAKVTNPCGDASKEINVFVCGKPSVTSGSSMGFVMGEAGSAQLTSAGTQGTWSVVDELPAGLTLNADTGLVSGIPTVFGNFVATVKVVNPCGEATQTLDIFICGKPTVTSGDMEFVMGEAASKQLLFDGSRPGTWSVTGNLPTGLSLNTATGVISGTPVEFGIFDVAVKITNTCGEDIKDITIFTCAKPTITSGSSMEFVMGEVGEAQLTSSGTQGVWSISGGSLPEGLTLNGETGVVSGTPAVFGNYKFSVKVVNPCGEATQDIDVFICGKPSVISGDMGFVMGEPSEQTLVFSGSRPGTWEIIDGALPTGFTLNGETGVISGTLSEYGVFPITVKITNPCGDDTKVVNITVCAKPTVTNTSDLNFVMNEYGAEQLTASGTQGVWTIMNGNLPNGLELEGESGIISGTPTVSGTYTITVKIENACGEDARTISIQICAKPEVTSGDMEFVMGEQHSEQMTFSGSRPGTWTIVCGELPTGLTLNPTTGEISGTPTEFGDFSFFVKIENHCGESTKELTIFTCGKPSVTSGSSMSFVMGEDGSAQLTSDGTQGVWSVIEGELPMGLVLDAETGEVYGNPMVFGNFKFTVQVENPCGEAVQNIDMFICGKPAVVSSPYMEFVMGEESSEQLMFSGSRPGTWTIVCGELPAGLELNGETGEIFGTPTVFGDYSFYVKIENPCGEYTKHIDMFVCGKPEVTSGNSISNFVMGEEGYTQLESSGTEGVWSLVDSELPAGLFLEEETGEIYGVPTVFGNFKFTVSVTNPCGDAIQDIDMFICGKPAILNDTEVDFVMDEYNELQLLFSGSRPGTWSLVENSIITYSDETPSLLPAGLSLNTETGLISGIPTEFGNFFFTVKIENPCGEDMKEFDLFICAKPVVTSPNTFETVFDDEISIQLENFGTEGLWSIADGSSLPTGLELDEETGEISGIPTVWGHFKFTVQITNPCGEATQEVNLFICKLPDITSEEFDFILNENSSQQLQFTGSRPGTWEITEGVLPNGLSLDSESGVISGTATEMGEFLFTVVLKNPCGEAEKEISIFVCGKPEVTNPGYFDYVMGDEINLQLTHFGTPGTWSIHEGELPVGLELDIETGLISGIAVEFGNFHLIVKVTNYCGEAYKPIHIFMCGLPNVLTENMGFVMGTQSEQQLLSTGTPGTWKIVAGTLPNNFTLNPNTGVISGTLTEFGDFPITVELTNHCGVATKEVHITVCATPTITSASELEFVMEGRISFQLTNDGTQGEWKIIDGTLPEGLRLNELTGEISGRPREFGDFTFTVKVTNPCGEDTQVINMFMCGLPIITNDHMDFRLNEAGSAKFEQDGTPGTWSIINGALPTGLTLNTETGEVSGTPVVSGHFHFEVKLENSCGEATRIVVIFVCQLPNIIGEIDNFYVVDDNVIQQFQFTGSRPGKWTVIEGELPEGLELDEETGVMSGVPTESGDFTITVQVENACGEATKEVNFTVCLKPTVITEDIEFVLEEESEVQLEVIGSEGTWSIAEGSLPNGLFITAEGVIFGTPTEFGEFSFVAKFVNDCGEDVKLINISICAKPEVQTTSLALVMDEEHPRELRFFGSPGIWSIVEGELPEGLELDEETGWVTGVPTEFGDFDVVVRLENYCGEHEIGLHIYVCGKAEVLTEGVEFVIAEENSQQLESFGTQGTWTITKGVNSWTDLPPGLSLNPETGEITGVPTDWNMFGEFTITVKVENSCSEDEKEIELFVCRKPEVTTNYLYGLLNNEYSANIQYEGTTPDYWSIVDSELPEWAQLEGYVYGLPEGLMLDEFTGEVSGTPLTFGNFLFTVKVENYCGEVEHTIHMFVCAQPTVITPHIEFVIAEENSQQLEAFGTKPATWSITKGVREWTDLPPGLSLNPETGEITGVPSDWAMFGDFTITVKVENSCGEDEREVTMFVCRKPEVTTNYLYTELGDEYSANIMFEGTIPHAWLIVDREIPADIVAAGGKKGLPQGLILDGETGNISGITEEFGDFYFTIKAENYCGDVEHMIHMFVCSPVDNVSEEEYEIIEGEEINIQLKNDGTPGVFEVFVGVLPTGLMLNQETGLISGIPEVFGEFTFTVRFRSVCCEVIEDITLIICGPPKIQYAGYIHAIMGEPRGGAFQHSGSPGTWSVEGTMPAGLTINSNGVLSGTPTGYGEYTVKLKVANDCGEDVIDLRFQIDAVHKIIFEVIDKRTREHIVDATVLCPELEIENIGGGYYITTLKNGTYPWDVSAEGYYPETGTVVADGDIPQDVEVLVELQPLTHELKFIVSEEGTNTPITDAIIEVVDSDPELTISLINHNNGTYTTFIKNGKYDWNVSKDNYDSVEGDVTIDHADEVVEVVLVKKSFLLTFDITAGGGDFFYKNYDISFNVSGQPVVDANIITTNIPNDIENNDDGTYEVEVLQGTYPYTIRKDGFIRHTGTTTISDTDVVVPIVIFPLTGVITIPDNRLVTVSNLGSFTATVTPSPPNPNGNTYRYVFSLRNKNTGAVLLTAASQTSNTWTQTDANMNVSARHNVPLEVCCTIFESTAADAITFVCEPITIWRLTTLSATLNIDGTTNQVNMWVDGPKDTFTAVCVPSGSMPPYEYTFFIRINNVIIHTVTQNSETHETPNTMIYKPTVGGLHQVSCEVRAMGVPFDVTGVSHVIAPGPSTYRNVQTAIMITAQIIPAATTIIEDTTIPGVCQAQNGFGGYRYRWGAVVPGGVGSINPHLSSDVWMLTQQTTWQTTTNALNVPSITQNVPDNRFNAEGKYILELRCFVSSANSGFNTIAPLEVEASRAYITIQRPPFNWKYTNDPEEAVDFVECSELGNTCNENWMGITILEDPSEWKPGAQITVSINAIGGTPTITYRRGITAIINGNPTAINVTGLSGALTDTTQTFSFIWPTANISSTNPSRIEALRIQCIARDSKNRLLDARIDLKNVMFNKLMGIITPAFVNGSNRDPDTNQILITPNENSTNIPGFRPGVNETRVYNIQEYGGQPVVLYNWKVSEIQDDGSLELISTFPQTSATTRNWRIPKTLADFETQLI